MTIKEFNEKHPDFNRNLERYSFSGGYQHFIDDKCMSQELLDDIDSCADIHVTSHSCGTYRIILTN